MALSRRTGLLASSPAHRTERIVPLTKHLSNQTGSGRASLGYIALLLVGLALFVHAPSSHATWIPCSAYGMPNGLFIQCKAFDRQARNVDLLREDG